MSGPRARRVVVALDGGEEGSAVLHEAITIARGLGTELEGVFVEDVDLFTLAGHPFALSIGHASGGAIRPADLEAQWRGMARAAQRSLERQAASVEIVTRFVVERARPREVVHANLDEGDVVVIAWAGRPPRRTADRLVRVLFDASDAAERALDAAILLAPADLEVWVVASRESAERVRDRLAAASLPGSVRVLDEVSLDLARRLVSERPGGLLLVPADHPLADRLAGRALAARVPCALALVR